MIDRSLVCSKDNCIIRDIVVFLLKGGLVLEVVVAKWWASLGEVDIDYSLSFYGLKPDYPAITMHGGDGIMQVEVKSGLRHEDVAPTITLKNQVQVLRYENMALYAFFKRYLVHTSLNFRSVYKLFFLLKGVSAL